MSILTFNEALTIFTADAMCVVAMGLGKKAAVVEMAARANKLFAQFTPTRENVSAVKEVITLVAA